MFQSSTVKWTNPTGRVIKFTIMDEQKQNTQVVVQPGESVNIPIQYTRAIHEYNKDGTVIVGGSAPALVREGQTARIHEALDFDKETRDSVAKSIADESAREELILAEAARIAARKKASK
jgi:hypothetical protein